MKKPHGVGRAAFKTWAVPQLVYAAIPFKMAHTVSLVILHKSLFLLGSSLEEFALILAIVPARP